MKQGLLRAGMLALWCLAATGATQGHAMVDITGDRQVLSLDARLLAREDPSGRLGADDLAGDGGWVRMPWGVLREGFTRSAWWLRLDLRNVDGVTRGRVLVARDPSLDLAHLHLRCDDGSRWSQASGDRLPFAARALPDRYPAFAFEIPPGVSCRLLLRLESRQNVSFPAELLDPFSYIEQQAADSMLRGMLLGALLFLAVLAGLFALLLRERTLGAFSLLVAVEVVLSLAMTGFGHRYLWPRWPGLQEGLWLASIPTAWILFSRFSLHLLGLHRDRPLAGTFALLWALVALFPALAAASGDPRWLVGLVLSCVGSALLLLAVTCHAVLGGSHPARGIAAGVVIVCVIAIHEGSLMLGVPGTGAPPLLVLQVGLVLQALLFGYAIAARALRTGTPRAGIVPGEELDRRVAERTRELATTVARLQDRNAELDRLSTTDALTGVHNRRYMDQCLQLAAEEMRAVRAPLSFILFDIDHFKSVNDRHGHATGDLCLRRVAACVQAQLRDPPDILCRYGGEEFAVILPWTDLEGAKLVAEKIRRAVAAEPLELPGGSVLRVTISLGVACWQAGEPGTLVEAADRALYRAKRSGRNTWLAVA